MRLFAIGDTHLPSLRKKDMHRFGWTDHPFPLQRAWDEKVRAEDVVLVVGDISWATRATEVLEDLKWIDERPGRKILVRGNHDFWWGDSASKLRRLLEPFTTIENFLQASAVHIGPWVIAGSRLWTAPEAPELPGGEMGAETVDEGYVKRETARLARSIEEARKLEAASEAPIIRVAAVHFPPLYANAKTTVFSEAIEAWAPQICVYGHLHAEGIAAGFKGDHAGVRYVIASCDAAGFSPVLLHEGV